MHRIQEATGYEPNCSFTNWTSINSSINSSDNYCCSNPSSLYPLYHDWILLGLPVHPNCFNVLTLLALSTILHTLVGSNIPSRVSHFSCNPCKHSISCFFCFLSLSKARIPPWLPHGVAEPPEQIFYFTLLCLQIPQVEGSCFLGCTHRCRPAAGGVSRPKTGKSKNSPTLRSARVT